MEDSAVPSGASRPSDPHVVHVARRVWRTPDSPDRGALVIRSRMVAGRLVVVMCIASCKPAVSVEAPRNHTQVPTARLAIAGGNTVRIVRVDGGKLTVEQTTQLADEVDALFWVGKDPAVWLVADAMGCICGCDQQPGTHKEIHPRQAMAGNNNRRLLADANDR